MTALSVSLQCDFNPPAPWGGGTLLEAKYRRRGRFQSTRPVGGGTYVADVSPRVAAISIHPPRGGRDAGHGDQWSPLPNFNSPVPWGGGTLPGQRSTVPNGYFNPPAPWGAGLQCGKRGVEHERISIHPPRGGRDLQPLGRPVIGMISIHPPRGGRDLQITGDATATDISIHPPRGGRDPPLCGLLHSPPVISIHPPRGGAGPSSTPRANPARNINPPCPTESCLQTR